MTSGRSVVRSPASAGRVAAEAATPRYDPSLPRAAHPVQRGRKRRRGHHPQPRVPGGAAPRDPSGAEEAARVTEADRDRGDPDRPRCLSEVDIFRDLDDTEKAAVADMVTERTYPPGGLIYTSRDPCERLFILQRGRIRLFRVAADGRSVTCGILRPGTFCGEMLLFGQRTYGNCAEALDEVTVCVLNGADADRVLLSDPRIAARVGAVLGRRLADLEQRLSDSAFKSVSQRVATTLLSLAAESASGQSPKPDAPYPEIALTHGQLAAIVGNARESVTKVLSGFAELGLVRLSRGHIAIVDPEGLRAAAGETG